MKKQEFTFDIQRGDGGFKKALIRFANDNDKEGDRFESFESAKKMLVNGGMLRMDIFVSLEILSTIF